METINIRITFTEPVLGTSPSNENIYRDFIGSKAEDASTVEDEVKAIGVDGVVEKGKTIFPKFTDGRPFQYDYQIKGFFKSACQALKRVGGSYLSAKEKAFKKVIDTVIFVSPRCIPIEFSGEITDFQRPLRAMTMQGERVSLAISEMIPAGATMTFKVHCMIDNQADLVREWLDYGVWSGLGQWRNGSYGRFVWEELDDAGNAIGGNVAQFKD